MPSTFQALVVTAIALLPGAMYVWGFERVVGAWGVRLSDRLLRFVGFSSILHTLLAPATLWAWRHGSSGRLDSGDVPLYLWPLVIGYVLLPFLAGTVIGFATLRERRWATWFTGPNPAPRAWDYLFGLRPKGWMRLKLKSGIWIGGAYAQRPDGRKSYASGYPEPQEILLIAAVEMDSANGRFLRNPDGTLRLRESAILIRWEEVEFLEFIGI